MLLDDIRTRFRDALKNQRSVEKEILRVAIGEITTEEARGGDAGDLVAQRILKRLIKSNEETLASATDATQQAALREENGVLATFLPKALGLDEITSALTPVADAVRGAKSDGQAMGVAMKHLKAAGAEADGKMVAAAVARLRSP